jgi:hypothetical protein
LHWFSLHWFCLHWFCMHWRAGDRFRACLFSRGFNHWRRGGNLRFLCRQLPLEPGLLIADFGFINRWRNDSVLDHRLNHGLRRRIHRADHGGQAVASRHANIMRSVIRIDIIAHIVPAQIILPGKTGTKGL